MYSRRLVFIGGSGGTNIGQSLFEAAQKLGDTACLINHAEAQSSYRWLNSLSWRFFDKRPFHMADYSQKVQRVCEETKPMVLITTGISPIRAIELTEIKRMGIKSVNYLTDDPWNPAHRCEWFLKALRFYDSVFSVRRANMADLCALGGPAVHYLPFGYDPNLFYPEKLSAEEILQYESDVIFVGGADVDRVPYIQTLLKAGLKIKLYGSFWERYSATRRITQGQGDVATIRKATRAAKIALCLVRRANRDDNCMRSYEIPAIGACMLAEDTEAHREIFGRDGDAVLYFKTPSEMVERVCFLLAHNDERQRLALAAHTIILQGNHTYRDRLATMLGVGLLHG